ncbi:UNVERIFIED_CONTAM: Retrovirus-related Pol polyprotein from transposon RE1 [Sesamum radiatum]|uniref:Retrovirus-related Pol polyprotein from transposon RE1 n=1 Tax=Sesamum radiatum TaxID=300843 RepID=A0AAW2N7A0_SESRA
MLADPPSLPLAATRRPPSATSDNDLPIALCKASGVAAWKMAMDEMSAHISRGTWELVEVPPNCVACRWVFTPKFWADGTLEQYKVSVVAKGFTHTLGWATDVSYGIKKVFLYETAYMEQPRGYGAQEKKPHMVCKLKKAIFGLKQSPRAWFDKFNRITGEFGFSRCQDLRTSIVVLAIYVDDILITGSDWNRRSQDIPMEAFCH